MLSQSRAMGVKQGPYLAINKEVELVHSDGLVVVNPELDLPEAL